MAAIAADDQFAVSEAAGASIDVVILGIQAELCEFIFSK
jgi:hypothetical protein